MKETKRFPGSGLHKVLRPPNLQCSPIIQKLNLLGFQLLNFTGLDDVDDDNDNSVIFFAEMIDLVVAIDTVNKNC